jgi:hypothetical protein
VGTAYASKALNRLPISHLSARHDLEAVRSLPAAADVMLVPTKFGRCLERRVTEQDLLDNVDPGRG